MFQNTEGSGVKGLTSLVPVVKSPTYEPIQEIFIRSPYQVVNSKEFSSGGCHVDKAFASRVYKQQERAKDKQAALKQHHEGGKESRDH